MNPMNLRGVLAVAGVAFAASSAMAQFNHGDVMSTNYWFRNVTEQSSSDPTDTAIANAGNMFGAPVTAANSILFSCPNFYAQAAASAGGNQSDLTDGHLTFSIEAKQGSIVSSFSFNERGDYSFTGFNFLGQTSVQCNVHVRVLEVAGFAITPVDGSFSLLFSPTGGVYTAPPSPQSANWNGGGGINIDSLLVMNGQAPMATRVEVTLDNILSATTFADPNGVGTSRIVKKFGEGIVIDVLPAPGGAALLGIAGLLVNRRRR